MFNQFKKILGIEPQSTSSRNPLSIDWVIPGTLAVGRLPHSGDAVELAKANIKVVFSLCSEQEGVLPEDVTRNFKCLRLVLPDRYYTIDLKVEDLAEAVGIVRENIENNLPVYVHCLAGIERSPTVCIAYLCLYQKMELWEAVNWVKQVHPSSLPNNQGLRVIRELTERS